jgi:hypothetical protein
LSHEILYSYLSTLSTITKIKITQFFKILLSVFVTHVQMFYLLVTTKMIPVLLGEKGLC